MAITLIILYGYETWSITLKEDCGLGVFENRREEVTQTGENYMRVYPKVSGLAACSENCKWYSSLLLGAVI
jgi:hypothetical protein